MKCSDRLLRHIINYCFSFLEISSLWCEFGATHKRLHKETWFISLHRKHPEKAYKGSSPLQHYIWTPPLENCYWECCFWGHSSKRTVPFRDITWILMVIRLITLIRSFLLIFLGFGSALFSTGHCLNEFVNKQI